MNNKTMMVVRGNQRTREGGSIPTFRLIPIDNSCCWLAAEYDVANSALVMFSKTFKPEMQTVPKIDKFGQYVRTKGSDNPEVERRMIEEYFEISINDKQSILSAINTMCVNADETDLFMPFLAEITSVTHSPTAKMEKPASLIIQ